MGGGGRRRGHRPACGDADQGQPRRPARVDVVPPAERGRADHRAALGQRGPGLPGRGPRALLSEGDGRAEYLAATDKEALAAFERISRLEGIIPALETSHAFAQLPEICRSVDPAAGTTRIVLNLSGRGDKDVISASKHFDYM